MTYKLNRITVQQKITGLVHLMTYKKFCTISDIMITKPLGTTKSIKGWIKSLRKRKEFIFLDLSDGSSISHLQVVLPKKISHSFLNWGASIDVEGKIHQNPNGQLELHAEKISVLKKCELNEESYPFSRKEKYHFDYYREYLHLRPQVDYFTTLLHFRNAATFRVHQYFNENGFIGIHTPIITSNDCEGAGEVFMVEPHSVTLKDSMKKEFFNKPAYLTVSSQLHLEVLTRSIPKVYSFNPSFRAENSKSRFHLSEFYMVEVEEAFVTDLKVLLKRIEDFFKDLLVILVRNHINEIEYVLKENETNISEHMKMLEDVINKPFLVMTFAEAKALVEANLHKIKKSAFANANNLTKEEELFIVNYNDNTPVFVIDWPKNVKPFYMKQSEENSDLVKCVDFLAPNVGEVCGGSLREDDYNHLKEKLNKLKSLDFFSWYLDLRAFRNVPTAGFGMGFERFLQFLLNVKNIKDTLPFPRWPHGLQL